MARKGAEYIKGFRAHPKMVVALDYYARKLGIEGETQDQKRAILIRHILRERLVSEGLIEFAQPVGFVADLRRDDQAELRFKA